MSLIQKLEVLFHHIWIWGHRQSIVLPYETIVRGWPRRWEGGELQELSSACVCPTAQAPTPLTEKESLHCKLHISDFKMFGWQMRVSNIALTQSVLLGSLYLWKCHHIEPAVKVWPDSICVELVANDKVLVGTGVWMSTNHQDHCGCNSGTGSWVSEVSKSLFHPLLPQKQTNANMLTFNSE